MAGPGRPTWRSARPTSDSHDLQAYSVPLLISNVERATVSLPSDLAAWARAGDNVSAYIAGLIRRDKHHVELMEMLERHVT